MKLRLLVLAMSVLCASEAFANNYFIPNYYRNRRFLNAYTAVGWSDRKEAGATYSIENTDNKSGGQKTSKVEESNLRAHTYYRTPMNLNVEAAILSTKQERESISFNSKDKHEIMSYNLGLGYELTDSPLAFGLVLSHVNDKNKTSSTDRTLVDASGGVGYRLDGNVFLGLGYHDLDTKSDRNEEFALGVGKVYGDRANPSAATELVLTYGNLNDKSYGLLAQGLINAEALQYYGRIGYMVTDGTQGSVDTNVLVLMAGADYKFFDFYVGPQLSYDNAEFKSSGSKATQNEFRPSLEAGYRIEFLEAFLRYDLIQGESKFNSPLGASSKNKSDGNVLTANVTYKF